MMKKFMAFITAICVMYQTTAFAQINPTQASEGDDIKIDIVLPDKYIEDYYSVYVLNPGKTKDDLTGRDSSAVQYYHQGEYKEGGETINFKINRELYNSSLTPHFKVLLRAGDYSEEMEFSAYTADVRSALLAEINSKQVSGIADLADRTVDIFNAKIDGYDNISDKQAVAYKLFELYGTTQATANNITKTMEQAILISGAESGEIAMIDADNIIYGDVIGIDSNLSGLLSEIKNVSAINTSLKGRTYSTVDAFKTAVSEEIILAAVYDNKSLGYGHIEDIVSDYSSYFVSRGLNLSVYNSSQKDLVAQSIVSTGKVSFDALIAKLNSVSVSDTSTNTSSSGGNSSGFSDKLSGITAGGKTQQTTSSNDGFADLSQAEWARAKIMSLKDKGIVSGDGGNFYPNNSITRAELTKMVVDALGINADADLAFDDVAEGAWYESYIKRGVGASIIYGDVENFFPNQDIKRQDIAAICYRALNYKGISLADTGYSMDFSDVSDISDYAKESVERLYQYGIINGNDLGQFLPNNNATRAEAAVIIWGMLNGVNDKFIAKRTASVSSEPEAEEKIDTKLENNVFLMVRAGIVSAENAGNTEKKVTRSEFAKILARYANKENITSDENFYDDVMADTENAEYINGMTSLGYLSAREGRIFEPSEFVTQNEVKVAILNVLGYASAMKSEEEYLKTASDIGLESDIPCRGNEAITMGGILSLFESSLEKEVMKLDVTASGFDMSKGSSFLESFYDISITKGIMNGNNITNYNTNISPKANKVLINSTEYEIDDDLYYMNDYLGYYMQVAYREKDKSIVGFIPLKNSELVVSDSEISGYSDGRIYYSSDNEHREKSVKIPDNAIIIYNGVVEKSYTEDMFSIESGSIEFVGGNSDTYNVVKIYDYNTVISNGVSVSNNKMYSKNTDTVYSLENYDNVIIRTGMGTIKKISDIVSGNILSIAESKDKRNIIITVADEIVRGKLTGFNASGMTCMIDGKKYDVITSSNLSQNMVNSSGAFYLDYKGRVAWAEAGITTGMRYGYLVKAGYDEAVDGVFFKIFTDEGNMETLSQTEAVEIDGEKVTGETIHSYFRYNINDELTDKMQPQLIRYKMNSDGVIKTIDTTHRTVYENDSSLSVNRDAYSEKRQFAARTGRLVDITLNDSSTLYNAMRLDANTVIFKVPDVEETADSSDEDYSLVPYTSMYEGKVLAGPVLAYDTDFENADLVGALTYSNLQTESGVSSYTAFFVKSVEKISNRDGEILSAVTGYDYQSKSEKTLASNEKENVFASVKAGDVIRYALDEDNLVIETVIDIDWKTVAMGQRIVPWTRDNTGIGSGNVYSAYQYGIFTHKNGNYVNFADKIQIEDGKIKRGGMTYDISDTYVILFDTKTGKSREIASDELGEYIYTVNPDARVYINPSYTQLVNVIIYI